MASKLARCICREKRKDESWQQFATRLGFPKTQLFDWAHEKYEPNLVNLRRLAVRLDREISDLT